MPFDVQRIRDQLRSKLSSRPQDPFEFRPPKAKKDEVLKLRFYILPPLAKGDKCYGGTASRGMDDLFCIKHGNHWINSRPYACPRVNRDEPCELCDVGFDMLRETEDKDKRAVIIRNWLAQSVYLVNIYFPNIASNPEALRGKVMYFNAPKTCFDQWYAAINRDSGGDAADPEAYGVFYDPEAAFLYQLEITLNGNNNGYKTSKFLAQMGAHPIARLKDNTPDRKRIDTILGQRHDLWTKVEEPNPAVIAKLCRQMLGEEEDDATSVAVPAQFGAASKSGSLGAVAKPPARKPAAPPPGAESANEQQLEDELLTTEASATDGTGAAILDEEVPAEEPPPKPVPKKPAPAAKAPAKPVPAAKAPAKPAPAAKAPAKPVAIAAAADEDDSDIDRLLGELTFEE